MYKPLIYDNKETQYIICSSGIIYNTETNKNIYGTKSNGYIYVNLTINGKQITFSLHRLLAEYFIPNPENKEVVHHIDGNTTNNKLDNLMWVTQKENCLIKEKKILKKENRIPLFSEEELDTEIWKDFKNTFYQVSNLGRYKNTKTGYISCGSQNKNSGYIRWSFSSYGEVQAHRAVYEVFYPDEEIKEINHIDGNRANNRLSNLENISHKDNICKSYYDTRSRYTVFVAVYDKDVLIDVFPSYAKAAEALGVSNGSVVRNAAKNNHKCQGYNIKIVDIDFYKTHVIRHSSV